jgi:probable phosphoglycerate mutase
MNAVLVRHAETDWSASGRHTGRTDVPLNDTGRQHARALASLLAGEHFALVLCSPLSRARETAEIAGLGDGLVLRDDLLEWDYGEYEGITTPEIWRTRPDWWLWRDGCPGGEQPEDVARRVDRVIAEVVQVEGDVALVAHGHVLRALSARWLEQPVQLGGHLALSTASVSRLGFERDVRAMWRWNQTASGAPR